ncbi:galactose mutarotase-like isoform X1 [Danaus plexippus]|uniref:Galactose mutarotase n=1 Tax=Danaus plexippus plexippus TaxID=278856 RepID=A0A212EQE3_DANPL|nr:galactose mutarotase-like isoform X1 [Danaus plexippus]OWR43699.1 aldose-1-epimerase [Danaus plexippus plexippus]
MAEATDDNASGDTVSVVKPEVSEAPVTIPPPKPDVELIVDGFGFMPKDLKLDSKSLSTDLKKSSKVLKDIKSPVSEHSPCASSTNIDIVRRYTWRTKNRMTVQVITYGATITSIQVPDKRGVPDDVVAGFDTLEEYFQPRNPYFGATIGRYANYIQDGTMVVRPSGRMYMLSTNKGHNHYHGGYVGFDKVNWRSYVTGNKVIMSHVSERFHEGYPGTVMAQISFEVTCDNTIKIEMKCTTSEPTIVNLSNTNYFNLAGHHSGPDLMYDHIITINADKYTAVDDDGLVTGEKNVVGGTPYDFRVPRSLRVMLPKIPMGGYDINFCVTQGTEQDLTFQARALHPLTGRVLEIYSNQPGMQFYTGNLLPDPDKIVEEPGETEEEGKSESESESDSGSESESNSSEESARGEEAIEEAKEEEGKRSYGYVPLMGKHGTFYRKHGLFCMMPQNYPDAVNHKNFPNSVLNPGETYIHKIQYKFGILLGKYV